MADVSPDKLCNASARGNLTQVSFLLQNGAHVNGFNSYGRTALQVVMLGSTAVVEALLEAGANPNLRDPVLGLTVGHDAAREGFPDTVRALLAHGADVNVTDARGNLPLHLAARQGHVDVVRLLIRRTAQPGTPNGQGLTAGQLAALHRRTDTARWIDRYLHAQEEEDEDED